MRSKLIPLSAKALSLVPLLAAMAMAMAEPTTAESAKPPKIVVVKKGDLSLKVTADGWFAAIDPVEVRFRPRAYVGDLKVESVVAQGATVKAGEAIFRVNTDDINRQIATAENDLAVAAANLAKAEADVKLGNEADALAAKIQAESLAWAGEAVGWWEKVDGPQQLKQYELQLRGSAHNVEDQQDELDQLKKMYKSEELTNQTADIVVKRALRQLEFSQIGLEMTKSRVEKGKATDYEQSKRTVLNARDQQQQATAALSAAQAQGSVQRQAGLVTARTAHDGAYRKLNDLRADAASMTVMAAGDGIVLYGRLVAGVWQGNSPEALGQGDKVAADQVVATIVQPGKVRFIAAVPEDQVARVRAGDPVVITPKSTPERSTVGKCGTPSPVASIAGDPAKFEVPVEIDVGIASLLPGYRASVEIDVADASAVLLVPKTAVSDGKVIVTVAGKKTKQPVSVGRSDGEMVEIARGLKEGDAVLATFKEE